VSNAFLIVIVFNAQRSTHDGSTESRPTIFLIADLLPTDVPDYFGADLCLPRRSLGEGGTSHHGGRQKHHQPRTKRLAKRPRNRSDHIVRTKFQKRLAASRANRMNIGKRVKS
jgi:hypothetical protein